MVTALLLIIIFFLGKFYQIFFLFSVANSCTIQHLSNWGKTSFFVQPVSLHENHCEATFSVLFFGSKNIPKFMTPKIICQLCINIFPDDFCCPVSWCFYSVSQWTWNNFSSVPHRCLDPKISSASGGPKTMFFWRKNLRADTLKKTRPKGKIMSYSFVRNFVPKSCLPLITLIRTEKRENFQVGFKKKRRCQSLW